VMFHIVTDLPVERKLFAVCADNAPNNNTIVDYLHKQLSRSPFYEVLLVS
jgi:hypothetical protein